MFTVLPRSWLEQMLPNTLWGNAGLVLIAIVCMVIVVRGADWLVDAAAGLAHRLGMSKMVIGATIVSLGTTSPEAAVSVLAAWSGNAGLALGNGVGSIIVDTGLIFAIACLWMRLPADRFILKRQGLVKIGVAIALVAICYALYAYHGTALLRDEHGQVVLDAHGKPVPMARIARWIGLILVVGLVIYLAASVRWARQHTRHRQQQAANAAVTDDAVADEADDEAHDGADGYVDDEPPIDPALAAEDHIVEDRSVLTLLALGALGLVLVVAAGDALVQSVSVATTRWGVPEVVVAATLVAFGTSLPELMVAITSIRKGHAELMIGNVIGADILNVLFVIGAAALASPLAIIEPGTPAPMIFLHLHLPVMLAMVLLLLLGILGAMRTGRFSRLLGLPLLLLYVGFVTATIVLATP